MLFKKFRSRRREKKLARGEGPSIVDQAMVPDQDIVSSAPPLRLATPNTAELVDKFHGPDSSSHPETTAESTTNEEDIYDDSDVESLSDIAPNDVDREFATIVSGILKNPDQPNSNGAIRNVQIVGHLRDGGWGWVCLDVAAWGQSDTQRLASLGYESPQPGDAFRARVRSYGSLHFIDNVDKHSLVRVGETRRPRPSLPTHALPESVRNTWRAALQPGDIVAARIPFGPLAGVDGAGSTAKTRPAVFVGWTEDEAIVRRISGVGGYLDRNGGIRLRLTPNLKKESVVSPVDQYVEIVGISKKLTRIHPTDAGHAQIPLTSNRAHDVIDRQEPSKMLRFDSVIEDTVATLSGRPLRDDLEILELLLRGIRSSEDALLFSALGELERIACSRLEIAKPTRKMFDRVSAISRKPEMGVAIMHDDHGHPVATFVEPRPDDEAEGFDEARPADSLTFMYVSPVLPEDYVEPDVVILDQLACHLMLQDRRTDLAEALSILRSDSTAPCFLIGSADLPSLQSFQKAARYRGWTVVTAETREATLSKAVETVRQTGAEFVTIVTDRADIVAEVEAYGCEVTAIGEWA